MGCYDTVIVRCPECDTDNDLQSKGGDCLLRTFTLLNCPLDVLMDVNRHTPAVCHHCGTCFRVAVNVHHTAEVVKADKPHERER